MSAAQTMAGPTTYTTTFDYDYGVVAPMSRNVTYPNGAEIEEWYDPGHAATVPGHRDGRG